MQSFGFEKAIFPYNHQAIFSMPVTFFLIWLFSITDNSKRAKIDRESFAAQDFRANSGISASQASNH